jgi:hypothetical protein
MTPYIALLFFIMGVAYFGRVSGGVIVRRVSVAVVVLALIGFAGLRDYHVGTDTGNYVYIFSGSTSFASVTELKTEVGYNLLSWVARWLSNSYSVLLLLIAAIVVSCYVSTIVKLARRYETALFLFVALGVYTFFFNGARQGIAAALCFWALPFLLDRRLIPYLLAVGVASLFHKTALIALPLYFLAVPRIGPARLAMLAVGTVALIVFLRVFVGFAVDMLEDRYAAYVEAGSGGGMVVAAFLFGQGVLLYWLKRVVRDHRSLYVRLLNIYLIGVAFAIASVVSSVNPSGLLRLHQYFSPVAILMWPMIFAQFGNTTQRALTAYLFLVVTMIFFVLTTTTFAGLVPYQINQESGLW